MITPEEIRGRAERFYRSKMLKDEAGFPWTIRGNKSFEGEVPLSQRIEILDALRQESKEHRPDGYSIEWKTRRVDGGNSLPSRIVFETREDLLS